MLRANGVLVLSERPFEWEFKYSNGDDELTLKSPQSHPVRIKDDIDLKEMFDIEVGFNTERYIYDLINESDDFEIQEAIVDGNKIADFDDQDLEYLIWNTAQN